MKTAHQGRPRRPTADSPASSQPKASRTTDILGRTARAAHVAKIKPKWARYYKILRGLRRQLQEQTGQLAKEATEGLPSYSMHMADAGTDSFDRDFALSMLSSDQEALYEIEQAISRIEHGTYGRCELTGKPISESRLAAIPWTRFTADAQRKLERDGSLKRRHLGKVAGLPVVETVETEEGEEGGKEMPEHG